MTTNLSLIVDDASRAFFVPTSKMTFEQQTQLYKGSSLHAFDGTGYFTFYFEGMS